MVHVYSTLHHQLMKVKSMCLFYWFPLYVDREEIDVDISVSELQSDVHHCICLCSLFTTQLLAQLVVHVLTLSEWHWMQIHKRINCNIQFENEKQFVSFNLCYYLQSKSEIIICDVCFYVGIIKVAGLEGGVLRNWLNIFNF